jgi:hypothetical protein
MKHSRLGASGAERWMACPGSISLLKLAQIEGDSDEADYRRDGQCSHAGACWCLVNGADAWEIVGHGFDGGEFTAPMAMGVQVYLDAVRSDITPNSIVYYEQQIADPAVHADFFGTTDCGVIEGEWLIVSDYKNGAGITVDVEHNPQVMYYAYGLLRKVQDQRVKYVRLRIVQPNDFNPEGHIREWETTAEYLCEWAERELVPAMRRTETDASLAVGSHCRFCPAKLVCPAMRGLFGSVAEAGAGEVTELDDAELGRQYVLMEPVMIYRKALGDEVYRRLMSARDVPGAKLVEKKADRVWKEGSDIRFRTEFEGRAFSPPVLLSPAQMEKLSPDAKKLVKEWAYQPKTGYTVDLASSKRMGIKVRSATETFAGAVERLEEQNEDR